MDYLVKLSKKCYDVPKSTKCLSIIKIIDLLNIIIIYYKCESL